MNIFCELDHYMISLYFMNVSDIFGLIAAYGHSGVKMP